MADAGGKSPMERRSPMQSIPDSELLKTVQKNDGAAISELYERYAASMMGVAMRILRSREDSEDLVHDVFIEAWQRADAYREARGTVRAWLLVRTRSRAIDRLRTLAIARRHVDDEAAFPPELYAISDDDLSLTTDHRRARECLLKLPDPQREALELAYFAGLSCSEIAGRTGSPVGTVKSRMAAGLSRLRGAFGTEGIR